MDNTKPCWRVIYEEIFKESYITKNYIIQVLFDDHLWYQLYETTSLPKAQLALERLKELYYPIIYNFLQQRNPIMFEVNGYVYRTDMILTTKSYICGSMIEGNVKYYDYEEPDHIFDYLSNFVNFYDKGDVLVVGKQVFLNGNLLLNYNELEDVCKNINQDINNLDYDGDKFIRYIVDNYKEAKNYICGGYTKFNIRGDN